MPDATPFPRSYWVEPGLLLAGYFPGAPEPAVAQGKLAALLDCGIRVFINLMEPDETDWDGNPFTPYAPLVVELAAARGSAVECLRFPIPDMGVPSPEQMRRTLDALDAALAAGHPAYVHCWGGKGRTGTVVGCYLARHGRAAGAEALALVQHLRRGDPRAAEPSPETAEQRAMVRDWLAGE